MRIDSAVIPFSCRWVIAAATSGTSKARWRRPVASGREGLAGGLGKENNSITVAIQGKVQLVRLPLGTVYFADDGTAKHFRIEGFGAGVITADDGYVVDAIEGKHGFYLQQRPSLRMAFQFL